MSNFLISHLGQLLKIQMMIKKLDRFLLSMICDSVLPIYAIYNTYMNY